MKSLISEGVQRSLCMQDTMRAERETARQRGSQDHTDDPDRMPPVVVESNPSGRVRDSLFSAGDKQETRKLLGQE
jgi:hypothetical protein